MLKDEDRIFKNLYNDKGSDVESSKTRGDWIGTKDLIQKGRDWIINEIKIMENLSLSNSCINCENLTKNSICDFHKIAVNEKYTCEEFENNPA